MRGACGEGELLQRLRLGSSVLSRHSGIISTLSAQRLPPLLLARHVQPVATPIPASTARLQLTWHAATSRYVPGPARSARCARPPTRALTPCFPPNLPSARPGPSGQPHIGPSPPFAFLIQLVLPLAPLPPARPCSASHVCCHRWWRDFWRAAALAHWLLIPPPTGRAARQHVGRAGLGVQGLYGGRHVQGGSAAAPAALGLGAAAGHSPSTTTSPTSPRPPLPARLEAGRGAGAVASLLQAPRPAAVAATAALPCRHWCLSARGPLAPTPGSVSVLLCIRPRCCSIAWTISWTRCCPCTARSWRRPLSCTSSSTQVPAPRTPAHLPVYLPACPPARPPARPPPKSTLVLLPRIRSCLPNSCVSTRRRLPPALCSVWAAGDADGLVPLTGTRRWVFELGTEVGEGTKGRG